MKQIIKQILQEVTKKYQDQLDVAKFTSYRLNENIHDEERKLEKIKEVLLKKPLTSNEVYFCDGDYGLDMTYQITKLRYNSTKSHNLLRPVVLIEEVDVYGEITCMNYTVKCDPLDYYNNYSNALDCYNQSLKEDIKNKVEDMLQKYFGITKEKVSIILRTTAINEKNGKHHPGS